MGKTLRLSTSGYESLFLQTPINRNRRAEEGGSDPMCCNKILIFTFPSFPIFSLFCNSVCILPFFLKSGKCVLFDLVSHLKG